MGQPDDIDKLLKEIEAMNQGRSDASVAVPGDSSVASPAGKEPAGKEKPGRRKGSARPSRGGRVAWTGASAVGGLVSGGVVGTVLTFLPSVSTLSTAIGAALGGAVIGLVSGPPRWFDDGE